MLGGKSAGVAVARSTELAPGSMKSVDVNGNKVLVVRTKKGGLHAVGSKYVRVRVCRLA